MTSKRFFARILEVSEAVFYPAPLIEAPTAVKSRPGYVTAYIIAYCSLGFRV